MSTGTAKPAIDAVTLTTDRPGEQLTIHTSALLPEVTFWTVQNSNRHWTLYHETYTTCLVLAPGALRASWRYRGRESIVSAHDVQLMEPGEVHATTGSSAPASFFVVWWQPAFIARVAEELGGPWHPHLKKWQTCDPNVVQSLVELYRAVHSGDTLRAETATLETAVQILTGCTENCSLLPAKPMRHPAVARAVTLLRERYMWQVSLDDLALQAKLSRFHFARAFKHHCGVSPHVYQQLLRISDAKQRIEQGESMKEAAAMSGFADQAHLCRSFKRFVGVSPGAWSRALRKAPVVSQAAR